MGDFWHYIVSDNISNSTGWVVVFCIRSSDELIEFWFVSFKDGARGESFWYYHHGIHYILVADGHFPCVWNWRKDDQRIQCILRGAHTVRLVQLSNRNATHLCIGLRKCADPSHCSGIWKHILCARVFQIGNCCVSHSNWISNWTNFSSIHLIRHFAKVSSYFWSFEW